MSEENVEIVRGIIDAHEHGDFDAVFAKYDPEIEWHIDRVNPTLAPDFEPVYYGHEGIRAFWRMWFAAWEQADFEYEEFIDAGDSVVTILSQRMHGRTSGIEFRWDSYAQIWTLRNDKVAPETRADDTDSSVPGRSAVLLPSPGAVRLRFSRCPRARSIRRGHQGPGT
jgi:ketosteroid isomerase-like protein